MVEPQVWVCDFGCRPVLWRDAVTEFIVIANLTWMLSELDGIVHCCGTSVVVSGEKKKWWKLVQLVRCLVDCELWDTVLEILRWGWCGAAWLGVSQQCRFSGYGADIEVFTWWWVVRHYVRDIASIIDAGQSDFVIVSGACCRDWCFMTRFSGNEKDCYCSVFVMSH